MTLPVFDQIMFGPARTLDLHLASPTADEAVRRTEAWLRQRQVARAGDVLVITGRGKRSSGGIAVVRPAVERLFSRLKRLGVIERVRAHSEGSFVVTLAPVKALFEAPKRSRATYPPARLNEAAFAGLSGETLTALRMLAVRSLEALGAPADAAFVEDEMKRQFALLAPGLPRGEDPDDALRRVAAEVMESLED